MWDHFYLIEGWTEYRYWQDSYTQTADTSSLSLCRHSPTESQWEQQGPIRTSMTSLSSMESPFNRGTLVSWLTKHSKTNDSSLFNEWLLVLLICPIIFIWVRRNEVIKTTWGLVIVIIHIASPYLSAGFFAALKATLKRGCPIARAQALLRPASSAGAAPQSRAPPRCWDPRSRRGAETHRRAPCRP